MLRSKSLEFLRRGEVRSILKRTTSVVDARDASFAELDEVESRSGPTTAAIDVRP